jgi:hypothetical protein
LLGLFSWFPAQDQPDKLVWPSFTAHAIPLGQLMRASEGPWTSVIVDLFRFIDQLGREFGTLGFPLGQWNTPGLQNRFLFRTGVYRQLIMNALSHMKRFHPVTP